ncbi:hypothetical protein [Pararhodospirillum photometricum]|nr:hypothetical protein [Pararhodospirillum photometricum]
MRAYRRRLGGVALGVVFLAPSAWAEDLEFTLLNAVDSDLVAFQVAPAGNDDWGRNLLKHRLPRGVETQVLIPNGMPSCTYDVRGTFANGEVLEEDALDACDLGGYTFEK